MPIVKPHPKTARLYDHNTGTYGKRIPIPILKLEGKTIIGYKKVRLDDPKDRHAPVTHGVVTLKITAKTQRQQSGGYKCRAAKAKVLAITDMDGRKKRVAHSDYDWRFQYRVGEWVKPKQGYDPAFYECASGIHFFLTEDEARNYSL